ncbi:S8 family serine peptidase [Flavobacterium sp. FlaQc-47]|uniref:S8 family serine peptidase n=1 Tax=Flavobacterium sp. FlaQc-47 TaxID=3374180 RepID=UPI0037575505
MKNLYKIIMFCFCGMAYSQTQDDIDKIRSASNIAALESLSATYKAEAQKNKERAIALARANGWSITFINKDGTQSELVDVSADGKTPIYLTPENVDAAKSTRANFLNSGGALGLSLDGQNMTAYVWDGGPTLPTHNEFGGRVAILDGVTAIDPTINNSQHANHVTGTIVAAGVVATAKGMANQANARTNNWDNDLSEASAAATNGMLISNHSYGWRIRNQFNTPLPAWRFGAYEAEARSWDDIMFNAPYYLMIKSAGNDGTDNTANTNPIGGAAYDKLVGASTAKNSLVIASANDAVISSSGALSSVTISSFSSQGPTDDLRIKPDLAGNGASLYSSAALTSPITPLVNNSYGFASGTSMASPNVTGTLLLLQQHYKNKTGVFMRSATLKGLALHTADDAGVAGPDAVFGWGLLNAKFAAESITKKGSHAIIDERTLNNGGTYSYTVTSDGINPLIVSLSWTDPAGVAYAGSTANIATAKLVNDLDIRVVNSAGTTIFPYKLLTATVNAFADNTKDPYEKIRIAAAAGNYTINISHKGTLTNGNQKYSVIVTGINLPVADLYIKDRPYDTGVEPNPDSGPMWISDDIWVRQNADGGLVHENPEYKTSSPNAVYIRVYNRGLAASSGGKVKLYYAKASTGLTWPTNFINYYQGGILHGDYIGEVNIPSIAVGSSAIVTIPWYPPNPAIFPTDQHHFCMTARIESATDPMFNEVYYTGIGANAQNNNNIAWKNLSVYNLNTTDVVAPTTVFIRGIKSKTVNVRFIDKGFNEELKNNFFELGGTIEATLDPKLFERAEKNGSLKGVKIIDKNKILITSREASIANLPIDIYETFPITFDFRVAKEFPQDQQITIDLVQEDAKSGELEGGERFALVKAEKRDAKTNEIVLAEAAESRVFTIYPNPTNGIFTVSINNEEQGILKISSIYNTVVFEEKTNKQRDFNVNIAKQVPGIYIVQFLSDNGTVTTRKIIKN